MTTKTKDTREKREVTPCSMLLYKDIKLMRIN